MLIVWDGNNIFRRCLAAPRFANLTDTKGRPSGGLYGTVSTILKHIDHWRPTHCVVAFDGVNATATKQKVYSGYKANRAANTLIGEDAEISKLVHHSMSQTELNQLIATTKLLDALGLKVYHNDELDADDIVGTVAKSGCAKRCLIVSNDKDFMQLLGGGVKQLRNDALIGPKEVKQQFGVNPDQIADFLALSGDSVDGIPGLTGCGPKTAASLLSQYGTIKGIAQSDSPWSVKLKEQKSDIIRFRKLTVIDTAVLSAKEIAGLKESAKPKPYKQPDLTTMIAQYGLGTLAAWVELHPSSLLDYKNELF